MDAAAPCFDRLLVIRDPVARSGALNMALDEVLLVSSATKVILRLYEWSEPTVSFGYFETALAATRAAKGRVIVRRLTGGGIVGHGDDLTYSLCVPRSCAFAGLRSAESYRRIHASLALALERSGLRTEPMLSPDISPGSAGGNACFERPVLYDLLADNQKIAGGAQRRSRGNLLHQGSVQIPDSAAHPRAFWKDQMWRNLPLALSKNCEDRHLTSGEISQAAELAEAKYANPAWADRF